MEMWKCILVEVLLLSSLFLPKDCFTYSYPQSKKHLLQLIDMKSNSIISFAQKGNTHCGTLVRICIFLL